MFVKAKMFFFLPQENRYPEILFYYKLLVVEYLSI